MSTCDNWNTYDDSSEQSMRGMDQHYADMERDMFRRTSHGKLTGYMHTTAMEMTCNPMGGWVVIIWVVNNG